MIGSISNKMVDSQAGGVYLKDNNYNQGSVSNTRSSIKRELMVDCVKAVDSGRSFPTEAINDKGQRIDQERAMEDDVEEVAMQRMGNSSFSDIFGRRDIDGKSYIFVERCREEEVEMKDVDRNDRFLPIQKQPLLKSSPRLPSSTYNICLDPNVISASDEYINSSLGNDVLSLSLFSSPSLSPSKSLQKDSSNICGNTMYNYINLSNTRPDSGTCPDKLQRHLHLHQHMICPFSPHPSFVSGASSNMNHSHPSSLPLLNPSSSSSSESIDRPLLSASPTDFLPHRSVSPNGGGVRRPHHYHSKFLALYAVLYPLPDLINKYIHTIFNLSVVGISLFVLLHFLWALFADVNGKIQSHALELSQQVRECATEYQKNRCHPKDRVPALQALCSQWEICMALESPMKSKAASLAAQIVGEVLNTFLEQFSWKSVTVFFIGLIGLIVGSNFILFLSRVKFSPPSHTSSPLPSSSSVATSSSYLNEQMSQKKNSKVTCPEDTANTYM